MAYTSLSAACHILYQNEKAIEYCGKGLKIFRGKRIRQGEGRSCLNLLSYYLHLGDYATALKYSEEALKAIRSNQKKEISVLSQAKICNIFMQYERSIGRCKIALIIKTAMADQQGKYQCYLAFGKTYNSLGQYRKAIHYANGSLKMGEELEIGDGSPSSIIDNALYYQGPFEESIEYFTKDLPICKAPRDHFGEGDYYSNIDTAYFALGQNVSSYKSLCLLQIKLGKQHGALCIAEQGRALWTCFQRSMVLRMPEVRERSILNAVKELVTKHQADMLYLATHPGPISIWFLKKDRRISSFWSARADSLGDNLEDILEELTKTILHSLDDVDCEDRSSAECYGGEFPSAAKHSEVSGSANKTEECERGNLESKLKLIFKLTISPFADVIEGLEIVIAPEELWFLRSGWDRPCFFGVRCPKK